jgi:hypothetical protein
MAYRLVARTTTTQAAAAIQKGRTQSKFGPILPRPGSGAPANNTEEIPTSVEQIQYLSLPPAVQEVLHSIFPYTTNIQLQSLAWLE